MTTTLTEQQSPPGPGRSTRCTRRSAMPSATAALSLFKGGLTDFDASLVDGVLRGSANVASITVQDENLEGHLLSPDFFDYEQFPRVSFESTSIVRDGDDVTVEGELELRGVKLPVTLTGSIFGPVGEKIGLELETTIDRTSFGMNWQMELPNGVNALDNEVTLTAHLELAKA